MMLEYVLVLSAYLFSISIYGLIKSRNMIKTFMCFDLILREGQDNILLKSTIWGKMYHQ
ncbi:hypothetical protein CXB51_007452 [Gossypium anomalum]|uniref:Uncharacterized protein n=1 Tax=Gossypium anomalum TaxID=47600 RepID=A0A8J6DB42_9ROSI|nr:hypothetical protein CXB51_007452 [Gossypium anomalum]